MCLGLLAFSESGHSAPVTAHYNSAAEIPVTSSGYNATGNTVDFALNFAPLSGASLTVVENTALSFIEGRFGNLAHGQIVPLSYDGVQYRFVANYYGGTGNDLILQWADTRPMGWGLYTSGMIGEGLAAESLLPLAVNTEGVLAGKTVVQLASHGHHALALCSDGTLVGWGYNWYGQVGINGSGPVHVPAAVETSGVLNGKRVTSIATGTNHSLALCSDGTVAAWGYNDKGQLGDGTTTLKRVPVAVNRSGVLAGKTVVGLAGGEGHSLALCSDGTIVAWGRNEAGELGNNTFVNSSVPVLVRTSGALAGKKVVAVAAGFYHNAALCSDGTIFAWGSNSHGQLGDGSGLHGGEPVAVATAGVLAGKKGASISAGGNSTFVLCSDGTLAGWGWNKFGQVGPVSQEFVTLPIDVTNAGVLAGRSVISISVGIGHNAALCSDGTLATWGHNNTGQLGDGSMTQRDAPGYVVPGALAGKSISAGIASWLNSLVLCSDGTIVNWGSNSMSTLGVLDYSRPVGTDLTGVLAGKAILSVAAGEFHSLAVCADGTVASWGNNQSGQLGDNTEIERKVPVAVSTAGFLSGKTVVSVATRTHHSLALCSDGRIAAWGYNYYGQLGNGGTTTSLTPVGVSVSGALSGKSVVAIAAGEIHSLALCSDGTLTAWGFNNYGQLGDNSVVRKYVPIVVSTFGALSGRVVTSVAAGAHHSIALCSDGTVAAWGDNTYGQLGDDSNVQRTIPVDITNFGVLSGKTVVAIAAGEYHSFALCEDGTVAAWGSNSKGQLGNDSIANSAIPVEITTSGVLAGRRVTALSGGALHSLALCSDGTAAAWGYNHSQQLGNGSSVESHIPVAVSTSSLADGERFSGVSAGVSFSFGLVAASPVPVCVTGAASAITKFNATLYGSVRAKNNNTSAFFEFGLTNSYGTTVAAAPALVTGDTVEEISVPLSGLQSGATYHYRVKAVNSAGVTYGRDRIFTTPADTSADLSDLELSAGVLSPAFSPATTEYTVLAPNGTATISLTPTTLEPAAVVQVNNVVVPSGASSAPISLAVGDNEVLLRVMAQDGVTEKTYKVVVSLNSDIPDPVVIDFPSIGNRIFSTSVIRLGAFASNGQSVTYSVSGPASIDGSLLTLTGLGAVTVTAAQGIVTAAQTFVVSDPVNPVLTVVDRSINARSGTAVIRGQIGDNHKVQGLRYRLRDPSGKRGPLKSFALITGPGQQTAFSLRVAVRKEGRYTLELYGLDFTGNRSPSVKVTIRSR